MSKIKAENYIVIQGWMVKDLALKNNELLIYAIIYGFSQDGDNKFTGTLQYLADWTGSTKQGVSKNLKSLLEKNLIIKYEKSINGVKVCEYAAVKDGGATKFNTMQQSCIPPVKQSLIPRTTKLHTCTTKFNGGVQQSLTNNIDIYNNLYNNLNSNKDNIDVVYIYKPELQQVRNYISFKKYDISAEEFYNYCESRNWIIDDAPIRNYEEVKALIDRWEEGDDLFEKSKSYCNNVGDFSNFKS